MKHPAADSATSASDYTPMEQSAGEKYSADPTKADFDEAVGISPFKETPVMSPVATVRLFSPKTSMNGEVDVPESAASWAELGSPSSLIAEQVPIFEPEQAAEVSQKVCITVEDEQMLPSEASLMDIGYNAPALMECEKASVTEPVGSPPPKDRDYYLESAQGGTELNEGPVKNEDDHDSSHEADSDEAARYEIVMTGGPVEAACNEVAEEAIDSSEEDVEAACSGDPDAVSESEFSVAIDAKRRGGRRRKRGRPSSKMQGNRLPSLKKQDEEVCFICFDGGDLVLCDRRGCPKVYHPSCVNREESYFQSKGQWSCGWHICSKCQKSASYMCYTCTYSLCKVCIDEADFSCIRGKKGFCPSCMSTILLMETSETADEKDGVDFNDRSCWEYLFKDYWLELKGKLSMNMDEITKAKTASKVCNFDNGNEESSDHGQGASSDRSSACHAESLSSKKKLELARNTSCETPRKEVQIEGLSPPEGASTKILKKNSRNATVDNLIKEGKADVSTVHQETSLTIKGKKRSRKTVNEKATTNDTCIEASVRKKKSSRKNLNKRSRRAAEENSLGDSDTELRTATEDFNWASMELLAFVSHVKNGDKSILSQYDVQELLLDYIKANNLRDPCKRSQIICDKMLLSLFHKSRVGHFEMLKLLESHFLINVSSPASDENQLSDMDPIEMRNETSNDLVLDKRKTSWSKNCELKASFNEYAAIDAYNINLMYLRRSLMEDLIDDLSTFNEKVIGSFVRIRVTASNQRQEVYRLVQVIGCGKAPEEYRTGKKTTDVMLEIINLDKKEVITIDIISNQDFTEEECKRLRQSIKFGFISTLTVGEVQEKARVLLAVRISDHLESEKLRLIHLRDRASEKGKKREHRECVEKLQLLSSPEMQMKRLSEVPEAHADPKMDPNYDSPEDDKVEDATKEGNPIKSTINGRDLVSPLKDGTSNLVLAPKSSNSVSVMGRAKQSDDSQSIELNSTVAPRASEIPSQIMDVVQKCNVEAKTTESKACAVETLPDNKVPPRESVVQSELKSETLPAKIDSQSNLSEIEKLWYYKDPSGKIQGPFSIVQLRKWSKHFPSNLGIWRKAEKQEDSVLLTDALAGNFKKDLPEWIPGDIKPVQQAKTNETTTMMNSPHLSSASLSTINTSKIQEVASSLSVPISQPSLLSHLAYQNSVPQNEKAVSGAVYTDLPAILGSKQITGSNDFNQISRFQQAVANVVHSETPRHQAVIIPSHGDPSNKIHDQPGTTPGRIILPGNGDFSERVSAPEALVTQKHDSTVPFNSVKLTDHSTSSTESNTMPEISPCDRADTRFRNSEAADVKPPVQVNALETVSQGSDTSTFLKPPPEVPQLAHPNSLKQNPGHLSISSCNWNVSNDTKTGEQATPALNSATMPSESTAMVSPNGSTPFSTPQMNMIWGIGTPDANNPGWQAHPNQYQNMHSGMGPTNPGWGMMTQGNMNMPWGAPPNLNMAWGQCGFALPQQGNVPSGFVWGAPQGNMVPNDACRPPAQVNNGHQYPIWQGNPIPNPVWTAAPAAGINMNQNAWIPPPVQGNPGTNNAPGTTYDNQSKENPSGSSMLQKDIRFREQNVGSRNGSFRGSNGSGQGSVRQPRNWMGASGNNSEGPLRPPHSVEGNTTMICKYFENGHCRKGSSCYYFHS